MGDIFWHTDMENCPNDTDVIVEYDDGSRDFLEAEDNDTDWKRHYPKKGPKIPGVSYPVAWAHVGDEL